MNQTKRQVFPVGLWIVATPIGNLEDMTPRARVALAEARWVLCEDTRRTAQLLTTLGISIGPGRLKRLDAHATEREIQYWVENLKAGNSIALVTDAGTPAVSDPGSQLVASAYREGVRVTPVPGVSAVSTLLSVAGFSDAAFTFGGFFPRKDAEQEEVVQSAAGSPLSRVFVWFESPKRIEATLNKIAALYPTAHSVVGKELTKLYEKIFYGDVASVASQVSNELRVEGAIGEWCFAIEFCVSGESSVSYTEFNEKQTPWFQALTCLIEAGIPTSEAVKRVCQTIGIPKKKVYEASLKIAGKKI